MNSITFTILYIIYMIYLYIYINIYTPTNVIYYISIIMHYSMYRDIREPVYKFLLIKQSSAHHLDLINEIRIFMLPTNNYHQQK